MTGFDLPDLLNERHLLGCGAELGVYAGESSARLLNKWRGRHLVSIDPWQQAEVTGSSDAADPAGAGSDVLYETSRARLERFGARSSIWRATSAEAADRLPDGCLDFVCLHADDDDASVTRDLEMWFPKVRPGGVLAGHHHRDGGVPEGHARGQAAVDSFFRARDLRVHVTGEPTSPMWIVELGTEPVSQTP